MNKENKLGMGLGALLSTTNNKNETNNNVQKINISQKFLIPKQSEDNGLKKDEWSIDENINRKIIRDYTRESGVRNLEREISKSNKKSC